MEEEKIDMREHLINWIDTFLKDGIIPKIVNPKAIETNYISKQVIRDKIKEIEENPNNPYQKVMASQIDASLISCLKELLEGE